MTRTPDEARKVREPQREVRKGFPGGKRKGKENRDENR